MYSASYTRNGGVYTKWENVTEEAFSPRRREMARCAREEAEAAAACDARAERSRCIENSVIVPYFTPLLQDIKASRGPQGLKASRGVKL